MNFNLIDTEFKIRFSEGFSDPLWSNVTKIFETPKKIDTLYNTELSQNRMSELIENGEYEIIIESVLKLINSAKVISRYEKIAFSNFIEERDTHQPLSIALYDLLYQFNKEAFEQMVSVLGMFKQDKNLNVLKWPIITLFNSYRTPNEHVLVKPNTVKAISKALNIDVSYTSKPNYITYLNVLNLVKEYRNSSSICNNADLRVAQTILFATTK